MLAAAAVLLRLTLAPRPLSGCSPGLLVAAGALGSLAAWTLLSSLWSHAPARAMIEFDRTLLYLLVLFACGLVPSRPGALALLLRAVAAALAVVCLAGLASRLLPASFPTTPNVVAERLSFPLTYWNAMGIAAALALLMLVHLTSSGAEARWVRVVAAGLLPAVAVTLYLTFSRGAIWLLPGGLLLYAVLALPRGLLTALPAAGLPALVAVRAAYANDALARPDFATSPLAASQGRHLALIVAGCMVAAALLRALALTADERLERVEMPAARVRRARLVAAACGVAVVVLAAVVADAPARIAHARETFARGVLMAPAADLRSRLTSASDNGRVLTWRVAAQTFRADPLLGTGAGTYRLTWELRRPAPPFQVNDGHSLYLEMASELGVPGVAMLLVALGAALAGAARRLGGIERHAYALLLAGGVLLLAHAAIDWDWEMPALFCWFWAAAGVSLAARPGEGRAPVPGRLGRVLASLAVLLLALTPALIWLSQRPLDHAVRAFLRGDCPAAVDAALAAAARVPARAEPFELMGWCDARAGQGPLAAAAMASAARRDPNNWQYAYGLAVTQALAGRDPRPAARRALALDPLEPLARRFVRATAATESRARWRAIAQRARIPVQ